MKLIVSLVVSRLKAWFSRDCQTSGHNQNSFEALEPRILYSAAPVEAPEPAPAETVPAAESAPAPAAAASSSAPAQAAPVAEAITQSPAEGVEAAAPTPLGATAISAEQDVTLVDVSEDTQQSVAFQAAEDTENMQLSLDADGNVQISEEGVVTFRQSVGSIGNLTITGNDLDNTLVVDFANGNPIAEFGLTYDGVNRGTDFDTLELANGSFDTATHTAKNNHDGSYRFSINGRESSIAYVNLEPINLAGNVVDLELDFFDSAAAGETITLDNSGAFDLRADSTAGESVDFVSPTASLTLNTEVSGGAGTDTINIGVLDAGFDADLIVNAGLDDTVNLNGALSLTTGTFSATGGTINVNADQDAAAVTLTGAVDLNANFDFGIGGTTPGSLTTEHEQIVVIGTLDISGGTPTFSARGGYAPATGDQFVIISNDGSGDAVTGTFASLAEGATIANFLGSGFGATISYVGGDGNDVVISVARPATDDTYQVANTGTTTIPASAGVLSNDPFITTTNLTLNYDANDPASAVGSTWRGGGSATYDFSFGSDVTLEDVVGGSNTRDGITSAYRFTGGAGATSNALALLNNSGAIPEQRNGTWEFWLRPDDLGDGNQIIYETGGGGDGMAIWYQKGTDDDGTGTLRFSIDNGSNQGHISGTIDRSDFHHVAAVYTKDIGGKDLMQLYIDGILVDDNDSTTSLGADDGADTDSNALNDWDGGDTARIGNNSSGLADGVSGGQFDGDISVFRFYEAALTQSEVSNNFNAVATPNTVTEINGVGANVGNPVALANGTVTVNADGSFSYTPTAVGNDSFTYTASDGAGLLQATVTLNQIANTAPTANDDPGATANESTAIIIDVLGNDVDPDAGQSRIVTVPATSANGVPLEVLANGQVRYDPPVALNGLAGGATLVDTFTYTFSDGIASDTATVTVTVSGESDAAIAGDDTASTDEDTAISGNVLLNDSDVDSITAGADLNFDASADLDGAEWENTGDTENNWVLVSDAGVAPVLTAVTSTHAGITQAYEMTGGATGGNNAFKLQDGNGADRSVGNLLGDATDESASFEIWFKPDALPITGNRQILFEDGGGTGIGLFIEGNNLVARKLPGSFAGDRLAVDISALAGDFIQAVLTFDRSTNPDQMELFVNGTSAGTFGANNGGDFSGSDPLAIGGRGGANVGGQGGGDSSSVSFQGQVAAFRFYRNQILDLAEVNQNFRAVNQGNILRVTEIDGQAADVGNAVTLASGAKVTLNANGTFDYDPNGAFEDLTAFRTATETFSYTVSDGVDSTTASVTVTINGTNDLPVANNDTATTDEDNSITVLNPGVTGNDTDADTTVQILSVNTAGTTGLVSVIGQTNIGEVGQLTVDGTTQTVTLSQSYTNAVVIAMVEQATPAGDVDDDPNTANARVFNVTGNSFQIKLQSPATGSTGFPVAEKVNYIVLEAGTYELANGARLEAGTISATATGNNNIAFTAGQFTTTPVALTQVMSENDSTYVNSRHRANVSDAGVDIFLEPVQGGAAHAAGETIGFIAIEQSFGTIGSLLYEVGVTGNIADSGGAGNDVSFINTYTAAPLFVGSQQTINGTDPSGTRFRYNGTGVSVESDEDRAVTGDTETAHAAEAIGYFAFEATTGFLQGVAVGGTTGGFTYNPNGQFENLGENDSTTDTFEYTVTDGMGETSTATATVTINGVNDAPVLASGVANFADVSINDINNDGDLVSTLINSQVSDDDDNSVEGIAITGTSFVGTGSKFEFFTVENGTWMDIGSVSDGSALVLRATDRVRFVPDTTTFDGGSINFRAWDQTDSTAAAFGTKIDASTNGDTTPFSTNTRTSNVAIANLVKDGDEIIFTSRGGEVNDIRVTHDAVTGELIITDHNGNPLTSSAGTGSGTNQLRVVVDNNDNLFINTGDEDDNIVITNLGPNFSGNITLDGGDDQDSIQFNADADLADGSDVSFTAERISTSGSDLSTGGGGTITMTGTGGGATNFSGIYLNRSTFTSETGAIDLTGEGGTGGTFNTGVRLFSSTVQSTGSTVSLTGTGGNGTYYNSGIHLQSSTVDGATGVTLDGDAGTGVHYNHGAYLYYATIDGGSGATTITGDGNAATTGITNTGIFQYRGSVSSASVSMTGTGGGGTNTNQGVRLFYSSVIATSGDAAFDGTGGTTATGSGNAGMYAHGATIGATGAITMDGQGGSGTTTQAGVQVQSSTLTAGTSITLTGDGGTGSSYNYGVYLTTVTATATGGAFTATGTANAATTGISNIGVFFNNATVSGTTVTLDGSGGDGTNTNIGVKIVNRTITATAGDVSLTGRNLNTTTGSSNSGVYVQGATATAAGQITVLGNAGNGTYYNRGIHIQTATLNSGSGASLTGNGGLGSHYNDGVYLNRTSVDGGTGATTVIGTANAATTGTSNMGINVLSGSNIVGTTLAMTGTGGGGTNGNRGLSIVGSTTRATGGLATLSGTALGATTGSSNAGVYMSGATIGGTGIDVNGIGGGGSAYNHGIYMNAITLFGGSGAVNSDDATVGAGATSIDKTGNFFPV